MPAESISENLPKGPPADFEDTEYFDVIGENGRILPTPVLLAQARAVCLEPGRSSRAGVEFPRFDSCPARAPATSG